MRMLICPGGFLGSGQRIFSRNLSECLGFYRYDLEPRKLHYHVRDRDGHVKEVRRNPSTGEERIFLCKQVLEDLSLISKMHRDVVVDDTLPAHRGKHCSYLK